MRELKWYERLACGLGALVGAAVAIAMPLVALKCGGVVAWLGFEPAALVVAALSGTLLGNALVGVEFTECDKDGE